LGVSDGWTTCPWSRPKPFWVPYRPFAIGLLLHLSEKVTSHTCFTCCIRTAPQLLKNVLPQPERGATNFCFLLPCSKIGSEF
jgi:hypothetical protein